MTTSCKLIAINSALLNKNIYPTLLCLLPFFTNWMKDLRFFYLYEFVTSCVNEHFCQENPDRCGISKLIKQYDCLTKLKTFQLLYGLHTQQSCHPSGHVWGALDRQYIASSCSYWGWVHNQQPAQLHSFVLNKCPFTKISADFIVPF